MPGVPFIYYGDEIGMRYLDVPTHEGGYHRTGSRTPMQWDAAQPNFGFSTADPESLYLPGSNRRVEFSGFQHRPTRLSRWCRTYISSPIDRYCSFRLFTRGGVHIWVDGVLAARFEPFTRNETQNSIVHLPLKASGSEVIVFTGC